MPTATYYPLAGKYGRVSVNSTVLNLSEHEMRASGEDIDTTHFESDVSSDGSNVFGEGLVGIVDAEVMIRGTWDGYRAPHLTPVYLFPGYFGSAFLGLSKTYGYTVPFRCLSTPVSQAVRRHAQIEGRLKSNGIMTLPSANYTTTAAS